MSENPTGHVGVDQRSGEASIGLVKQIGSPNVDGSDNTPIAATAGKTLHRIEAILRWCIGLIAGLVIWFLVTGNMAVSFLNTSGVQNTFALVSIALLAGASERMLPSLLRSFDDSIDKKDPLQQPKNDRT